MKKLLLLFAILSAGIYCNQTPQGPSCDLTAAGACQDFTNTTFDANFPETQAEFACTNGGGTWQAEQGCAGGAFSSCECAGGACGITYDYITYYYNALASLTGEAACNFMGGTFVTY